MTTETTQHFYVHRNSGNVVFVKEGTFFEQQGGLTQPWGKRWVRIQADSIEDARARGEALLGPWVPLPEDAPQIGRIPEVEKKHMTVSEIARALAGTCARCGKPAQIDAGPEHTTRVCASCGWREDLRAQAEKKSCRTCAHSGIEPDDMGPVCGAVNKPLGRYIRKEMEHCNGGEKYEPHPMRVPAGDPK